MLAAYTPPEIPLAVSTWGNDLTYHGRGSPLMRSFTIRTLRRADGLLADAQRDLRLGRQWGFDPEKPVLEVPVEPASTWWKCTNHHPNYRSIHCRLMRPW